MQVTQCVRLVLNRARSSFANLAHYEVSFSANIKPMEIDALGDMMNYLAELTWFKLTQARRLHMRMGEVSLTDHNLLALQQLASRTGGGIQLFHSHDEPTSGADFEIWLIDDAGTPFWAYSIQAKVGGWVGSTYKYRSIGHEVGSVPQYDLLLQHSRQVGTRPFHLLYNGWQMHDPSAPVPQRAELGKLGCAAVSTFEVARVRNQRPPSLRAADYLPMSLPWSELLTKFSPPPRSTTPVPTPPAGSGPSQAPPGPNAGNSPSDKPKLPGDDAPHAGGAMDSALEALEALEAFGPALREVAGELAAPLRRPTEFPDYVQRGLGSTPSVPPKPRPDDAWVPDFALVITVDT